MKPSERPPARQRLVVGLHGIAPAALHEANRVGLRHERRRAEVEGRPEPRRRPLAERHEVRAPVQRDVLDERAYLQRQPVRGLPARRAVLEAGQQRRLGADRLERLLLGDVRGRCELELGANHAAAPSARHCSGSRSSNAQARSHSSEAPTPRSAGGLRPPSRCAARRARRARPPRRRGRPAGAASPRPRRGRRIRPRRSPAGCARSARRRRGARRAGSASGASTATNVPRAAASAAASDCASSASSTSTSRRRARDGPAAAEQDQADRRRPVRLDLLHAIEQRRVAVAQLVAVGALRQVLRVDAAEAALAVQERRPAGAHAARAARRELQDQVPVLVALAQVLGERHAVVEHARVEQRRDRAEVLERQQVEVPVRLALVVVAVAEVQRVGVHERDVVRARPRAQPSIVSIASGSSRSSASRKST